MNLQKNTLINNTIKEEYLPPPLEKNYLSLFDIQVKMTKEFLSGSQEEKVAIIKRRIKKFFDYGNQDKTELAIGKKNMLTSPCQIDNTKLKEGLKIDCSKIIVYGSEMTTYETAEKMFPGFIGFEKIDDSNIKLSFSKKEQCQNLLIKNSKDPNSILANHIKNPESIEWFELQYEIGEENDQFQVKEIRLQEKKTRKYYARFVTNKDNLLLGNQSYFRKLLGKARSLIEQKESQSLMRQKQAEAATELNMPKTFKRKFIKRKFKGKKHHRERFETETNYDGCFGQERQKCFYNNQDQSSFRLRDYGSCFDQRYPPRSRNQLEKLDLSDIRPIPIDLENYSRDKRSKSRRQQLEYSKNSKDHMVSSKPQGKDKFQKFNLRDQMIKQYREKEFSNSQANVKLSRSGEADRFNGRNKSSF